MIRFRVSVGSNAEFGRGGFDFGLLIEYPIIHEFSVGGNAEFGAGWVEFVVAWSGFGLAADAKGDTLRWMLGWHLIFSTYGFWPPNDERGSGSSRVRAQHVYEAGGEATKVHTTHSLAARPFDRERQRRIKAALKYPAVVLSGLQARAVGRGIGAICPKVRLVIHACSIMPDHVHLVVARHAMDGDELIACLKRAGTRGMNEEGLHPLRGFARADGRLSSPWAGGGWKVMLFTAEQMRTAIKYVEENPVRAGFKRQQWGFVVQFLGQR